MEGNPPPTDYAAMLADMEAKYSALGNAISSLRAVLGTGVLGGMGDLAASSMPSGMQAPGVSLPRGAFLGKKAPEAIKLYLSAVRKKQTNKEIAQALKDGGLESTGSSFDNYVTGGLFRLKKDGAVLRFDDGWGLAEWYPESFRSRAAEKAGNGGKRKTKKKSANRAKKPSLDAKAPTLPKAKSVGLEEQILAAFSRYEEGGDLDAELISEALSVNKAAVSLALGRLAAKRKLEKTEHGYKLATGNVQEMPTAKAS